MGTTAGQRLQAAKQQLTLSLRGWMARGQGRAGQLAETAQRLVRELQRQEKLVHVRLEGSLPGEHGPLVLDYLGRQRFLPDFAAFFDAQAGAPPRQVWRRKLGPLAFARARAQHTECPADAGALFVDSFLAPPAAAHVARHATHLNAVLPVQPTFEAQLALIRSKGHRRKLQAALKRGYTARKSVADADFNLFYDVMYAPFVKERFADSASTVSRDTMYRLFRRRGFVLVVEQDGVPVSGAMMFVPRNSPRTLYYWKYGLVDSTSLSPALFGERNAMTEATVLQHAIDEGFAEIDFGLTRALPLDGIFHHKKRLGCDFRLPAGAPAFDVHLHPTARARLLSAFPMVVQQEGALHTWLARIGEVDGRAAAALEDALGAGFFASVRSLKLWTVGVSASSAQVCEAAARVRAETGCAVDIVPLG